MNQFNNYCDTQSLASVGRSSLMAVENSIDILDHLSENLKVYKSCMQDFINLETESIDTGSENEYSAFSQSHTLPGVISMPQPYYDQSIDNVEKINELKEKALRQKRIYLRFVEQCHEQFSNSLKNLLRMDVALEESIEILKNNIDLSIQPYRVNYKRQKMRPSSIKVDFNQSSVKSDKK